MGVSLNNSPMNKAFCKKYSAFPSYSSLPKGTLIFLTITAVLIIILLSFFVSGCGTPQKATSQPQTHPQVRKEPVPVDTLPKLHKQDLLKTDTFDIGLILPFYLDSVVGEIPDTEEVNYPQESTLAIEFYN